MMDAQGTDGRTLAAEAAERIAGFLSGQDSVAGATVASLEGELLASSGAADPGSEAALAAFVCGRATAIASTDDLRGMGKLVSESAFRRLAMSGPRGESLVYSLDGGCLLVSARAGQLAGAEQSAAPVINRFGPASAGRRGG